MEQISKEEIEATAERIKDHVHRTPLLTCGSLDDLAGCKLFFKCENFQKSGSFKVRGATNTFLKKREQYAKEGGSMKGVTTVSSGNMATALSYIA